MSALLPFGGRARDTWIFNSKESRNLENTLIEMHRSKKHRNSGLNRIPYLSLFWVLALVLSSFVFRAEEPILDEGLVEWQGVKEVESLMRNEPRHVVVDFVADWCAWCKVMDRKTFSNTTVADHINQNYYPIKLDYDSEEKFNFQGKEYTPLEFANAHGITSLPGTLFISSDLTKSTGIMGYLSPKKFLKSIKEFEASVLGNQVP